MRFEYVILQMKSGDELHPLRWSGWDTYQKLTERKTVDKKHYQEVYRGTQYSESVDRLLKDIFYIFNMAHPKDFHGHSISVSDIVLLNGTAYYCDSVGWRKVTMRGEKKHA